MDFDAVYDPSNGFNREGISREVRALIQYVIDAKAATGHDFVVSSTTDHPMYTSSGNVSRHRMAGTGGEGLAVDCRMRTRGNDIHRAVFDMFVLVEGSLQELIYAGAPHNVKAGRRVQPYSVSSHHDHVHVAVTKGTFLRWPGVTPKEVSAMFDNHRFAAATPGSFDHAGRLGFYSFDPDTSAVYAWNGAPGPVLSQAGQDKARAAGGIRTLFAFADRGWVAVVGNPGQSSTWSTWASWALGPDDRGG